jgi:hypothetical protein
MQTHTNLISLNGPFRNIRKHLHPRRLRHLPQLALNCSHKAFNIRRGHHKPPDQPTADLQRLLDLLRCALEGLVHSRQELVDVLRHVVLGEDD